MLLSHHNMFFSLDNGVAPIVNSLALVKYDHNVVWLPFFYRQYTPSVPVSFLMHSFPNYLFFVKAAWTAQRCSRWCACWRDAESTPRHQQDRLHGVGEGWTCDSNRRCKFQSQARCPWPLHMHFAVSIVESMCTWPCETIEAAMENANVELFNSSKRRHGFYSSRIFMF